LRDSLTLYQGHFLDQFFLKDSSPFDEWASLKREALSQRMVIALDLLVNYHERRGELSQAREWLTRLVALMPWEESGHRELIRCLGMDGHWSAAQAQYRSCERILKDDLDLTPSPATENLMEKIQEGERTNTPLLPRMSLAVHKLPQNPPHFVGRGSELDELVRALLSPHRRLVTIVGPGGIGKTRLAQETGRILVGIFVDGVFFIPLSGVSSSEHILTGIADALGYTFQGSGDTLQQLIKYLGEKDILIILDNCEHLLFQTDGEQTTLDRIVTEILANTPNISILATSRERLNLRAEFLFPLKGLPYPPVKEGQIEREGVIYGSYSSIQLFGKIANQVSPDFQLDRNLQPVSQICQWMEGLPLGIELAAARVRYQSCGAIAAQIERDVNTLTTTARDVLSRHQSLSAVFNHSWELLSREERRVLKYLTVFQGGCDLKAAANICGAAPQTMASLVDKSLIQVTDQTRFYMHRVIQQFAAERQVNDPQEEGEARRRHAKYYGDFVQFYAEELRGSKHAHALNNLETDVDNIRAAWSWASEHQDLSIMSLACRGLHQYYDMRSWYQDGARIFKDAAAELCPDLEGVTGTPAERESFAARLWVYHGWFLYRQDQELDAIPILNQCLCVLRVSDDHEGLAAALLVLGHMTKPEMDVRKAYYQESLKESRIVQNFGRMIEAQNAIGVVARLGGNYKISQYALSAGLEISQEYEDRWGESKILNNLGYLARELGNYKQAKEYHLQSLEIKRSFKDLAGVAMCYSNLGMTALKVGELQEARDFFNGCLEIYDRFGNVSAKVFILGNLGQVSFEEGDHSEALRLYQEANTLSEENNFDSNLNRYVLINIGELHLKHEDYQQAWEVFRSVLKVAWEGSYIPQVLEILTHVVEIIYQDDIDLAIELLQVVMDHHQTTVQAKNNAENLLQVYGGNAPEEVQSLEEIINRTYEKLDEIWHEQKKLC